MDKTLLLQGMLESLGWAILHSFWQMALLWLIFQASFGWHRRLSPALRHNAALLLLMIGSVWFLSTFIGQYIDYLNVGRYLAMMPTDTANATLSSPHTFSFAQVQLQLSAFADKHIHWISAIYLFVLCFMGWRLTQGLFLTRSLRKRGISPVDAVWQERASQWSAQLGIHRMVKVYLSQLVDVPATLGYLKPIILLPAVCITQLTPAQLETILIHELAHIRRNDYLVNIAVAVMETLLVHNPFARLLAIQIRRERELCCDDMVISRKPDAIDYATALLSIEKIRRLPILPLALASNGSKGQLLHRVRRMTRTHEEKKPYADRLMALCLMFLLMVSMSWMQPSASQAKPMVEKAAATERRVDTEITLLTKPAVAENRRALSLPRVAFKPGTRKIVEVESAVESVTAVPEIAGEILANRPSPRILVNQAPPAGFQFVYTRPESPEIMMERELQVFNRFEGKVYEEQIARMLQQQEQFNDQRMKRNEFIREREMEEDFRELEGQAIHVPNDIILRKIRLPRAEAKTSTRKARAGVTQPEAQTPELSTIFAPTPAFPAIGWSELEQQQIAQAMDKLEFTTRVSEGRNIQIKRAPAEKVRVNRVKVRDGYALRIETGKESIDIRIAADDVVVEKH